MKKGAEAPFFKNAQTSIDVCGLHAGAGNEARTRDLNLGKVALYQLSYSRKTGTEHADRYHPTRRFLHHYTAVQSRRRHRLTPATSNHSPAYGAGNEARTRDLNLGKVALYQLSYSRMGTAYFLLPTSFSYRIVSSQSRGERDYVQEARWCQDGLPFFCLLTVAFLNRHA